MLPMMSTIAASPLDRDAIMLWRKAERQRLISERQLMSADERRHHSDAIGHHLTDALSTLQGLTVGVYWPFRGEPNLRSWMGQIHSGGIRCALPVVIERRSPLVFRTWRPGAAMACGVWNIPVPTDGTEVLPDIVVAPVVGFDSAGYRLGYGGGYYDRTLAAMTHKPMVIGVGFGISAVTTIHPLPHDIPMQFIVTEIGCKPVRQQWS